ncbi:MAG: cyclodeaminase/cyclohydrolase family protein [Clostridiales bacterium]|nr:cyclodeaminase/cyclohydrolase family protein [Clostridiales bacterium]
MSFNDLTINEYTDKLASKAPVPGGGGASALCGAVGAALASMVCNLTIGKKKFAEFEGELNEILNETQRLQAELLRLSDEDAKVFEPLAKAYSLPKETQEEIEFKAQVMEKVLHNATIVPLNIMRANAQVIRLHYRLKDISSMLVISDVGCGAMAAKSALLSASLNVFINTKAMANREEAEKFNKEANELIAECSQKADETFEFVKNKLR